MKTRSIIPFAVLMMSVFSVAPGAGAAVLTGVTGTAEVSDAGVDKFFMLGTGISGSMEHIYVSVDDIDPDGTLRMVLYECDDADYDSPGFQCGSSTYHPQVAPGGAAAAYYNTNLDALGKRTIHFDFSYYIFDNGIPSYRNTTTTPLALNPAKTYLVLLQSCTLATGSCISTGTSFGVYGISTLLTDGSGNPIYCSNSRVGGHDCADVETPFYIFTDATELTPAQIAAYEYDPGDGFPDYVVPAEVGTGSYFGLTSTASVTGEDLGFFGNMLRDLAIWLFSPWDESTANAWFNFRNSLQVHIPFSYVLEVNEMFQDATVASGSISEWTYSNAPLGIGSISFFSSATITSYAPSGFLSALRALAVAALWLAFLWHVYKEALHLFG